MSSVRRKSSKRASARSTMHATHSDQASREALRVLNPPVPRVCPLASSITILLYTTAVSQALRGGGSVANFGEQFFHSRWVNGVFQFAGLGSIREAGGGLRSDGEREEARTADAWAILTPLGHHRERNTVQHGA